MTDQVFKEYKVGVPAIPTIGYIFAFKDQDSAFEFIRQCVIGPAEVWLCDAVVEDWVPTFMAGAYSKVNAFWERRLTCGKRDPGSALTAVAPWGTVYCSTLTLTKLVATTRVELGGTAAIPFRGTDEA
jgi:hypothetical protein